MPEITFELNKVVRNKLPAIMDQIGQRAVVEKLSGKALKIALIAKVYEELSELDPDSEDYKKELADLKQALNDLIALAGTDEVETLRQQIEDEKGDFSEGFYISQLSLNGDDEWVEYYRRDPVKYPEVKPE